MNVLEILERLDNGETVTILTADTFGFIRECERHTLKRFAITMHYDGPKCVLRKEVSPMLDKDSNFDPDYQRK